jgi:DNA-binding MarR family transcriptional regulator
MLLPANMIHGKLNKNEEIVFYGLIRYPLLNDRELATKLKLKMTTVTAIKNRLKKNKYYSTIRVPVLKHLGTELFSVMQTKFNPVRYEDEMMNNISMLADHAPEFVYGAYDSGDGFGFAYARNYSDMLEAIDLMSIAARSREYIENIEPPLKDFFHFPLRNSKILNYFDFGPLLSREFDLKFGDEPDLLTPTFIEPKDITLTNIEKRVLHGLVSYPELPDSKISEKINVTRQVISKLKKTFEDEGLIKTLKVPNFELFDYEILALTLINHNPVTPPEVREQELKKIMEEIPHIMVISGLMESMMLCLFKDFKEFQIVRSKVQKLYKETNFLLGEPTVNLYSIRSLKILTNHQYGPIVKKVLDISDQNDQ